MIVSIHYVDFHIDLFVVYLSTLYYVMYQEIREGEWAAYPCGRGIEDRGSSPLACCAGLVCEIMCGPRVSRVLGYVWGLGLGLGLRIWFFCFLGGGLFEFPRVLVLTVEFVV
jgi:hypothetical protein